MAATMRDAHVHAILQGWVTPPIQADYQPGVAITTVPPRPSDRMRTYAEQRDYWRDRDRLDSIALSYYTYSAQIINPNRPIIIDTEA